MTDKETPKEEDSYGPLEFMARLIQSTKKTGIDVASRLPGGASVSSETTTGEHTGSGEDPENT